MSAAADLAELADLTDFRGGRALAKAPLELLEISGPDRERLLHGLTTGEVRELAPGSANQGFFTTSQGRILADYRLLAREDRFWLLLPSGTAATIAAHLEKYKLASRVEIHTHPELPILAGCGVVPEAVAGDAECIALADPVSEARFLLLPQAPGRCKESEVWVRETTARLRFRRVGEEALELARIEDGELRFGIDFGAENFPQETGRETAVSYTKGCFLGQEVVARIHYRGGVQKRPCGLQFESGDSPAAGSELSFEGRPVGRATSVAESPALGAIGLAILHQRGAEPGTMLELDGGRARVVALPFERS